MLQAPICQRRERVLLFMDGTGHKVCVFLVFSCHKFLLKCERGGKKKSLFGHSRMSLFTMEVPIRLAISPYSLQQNEIFPIAFDAISLCLRELEEQDERYTTSLRGNRIETEHIYQGDTFVNLYQCLIRNRRIRKKNIRGNTRNVKSCHL